MKHFILTILLAAAAMNVSAQLVVDSIGRVGIGPGTPCTTLYIKANGSDPRTIFCNALGKQYGLYLQNFTNDDDYSYGIFTTVKNNTGKCIGGRYVANGNGNTITSQYVTGLSGVAGNAYNALGVFGGKTGTGSVVNFAGVFGSESSYSPFFGNYSGTYAGFFSGKVRVTNGIYAILLSPSASPSPSGEVGTTILSERGESVTDKLSQVQALQFLRYEPGRNEATVGEDEEEVEPKSHLSPIQYGLDTEQLKAVYPELVYEDANGNVSVNYVEMIPLLVQSIKELKSELAELKGTAPKKAKAEPTAIDETVSDVDMVRMDQNNPNPFSESTVITLNIPQQAQTASIFIYDMSGKQVQGISVSERGETNITVYASDLSAGMYIYTLVVDGKVAVTRRMIVTE